MARVLIARGRSSTVSIGRGLCPARRRPRDLPGRARGFTLVEVLIAAAILLVVALGILPLFMRSIVSNMEGSDHTQVANAARARAEEFFQLPFCC